MNETWEKAKDYLLKHYFKDDENIKKIAEEAYKPTDIHNKYRLSDWFKKNGFESEAEMWREKADIIAEDLGI